MAGTQDRKERPPSDAGSGNVRALSARRRRRRRHANRRLRRGRRHVCAAPVVSLPLDRPRRRPPCSTAASPHGPRAAIPSRPQPARAAREGSLHRSTSPGLVVDAAVRARHLDDPADAAARRARDRTLRRRNRTDRSGRRPHSRRAQSLVQRATSTATARSSRPKRLRAEFATAGFDPKRTVHQCGSGVSAAVNQLAMAHAGLEGSRIYDGSWSEWVADPSRPIAKGRIAPRRRPRAERLAFTGGGTAKGFATAPAGEASSRASSSSSAPAKSRGRCRRSSKIRTASSPRLTNWCNSSGADVDDVVGRELGGRLADDGVAQPCAHDDVVLVLVLLQARRGAGLNFEVAQLHLRSGLARVVLSACRRSCGARRPCRERRARSRSARRPPNRARPSERSVSASVPTIAYPARSALGIAVNDEATLMPRYWLFKTEPSAFSFEQLRKRRHDAVDRRAQLPSAQQHDGDAARRPRRSSITRASPSRRRSACARSCETAYPDFTQFDRDGEYFDGRAKPDKPIWFMVDVAYVEALRASRDARAHARRAAARRHGAAAARPTPIGSAGHAARMEDRTRSLPALAQRLSLREKDALRVDRHLAGPGRQAPVGAVRFAVRGS